MASSTPLNGTDLIDCAKASAKQGLETAARQCGYGDDIETFQQNLRSACEDIGIEIDSLGDLITDRQRPVFRRGIEVGPDTNSQL